MAKPLFYGWILLGALWCVFAFNLGFPAYGGPLINSAMAIELNFSRETLGLITSFYIIMSGLPGPLVAMAVNRFGVRRTLIAGSLLNVAGATFMATVANSGAGAYLGFGLIVGGGVCTGAAIASQTAVSRWFMRRRATAMAILYSSGAIAGFFATKFILPWAMAAGGGWRAGWWVIVTLSSLAGLLALLFVRERPEDMGLTPDGEASEGTWQCPRAAAAALHHHDALGFPRSDSPADLLAHCLFAGGRQRWIHAVPGARHRASAGSRSFRRSGARCAVDADLDWIAGQGNHHAGR